MLKKGENNVQQGLKASQSNLSCQDSGEFSAFGGLFYVAEMMEFAKKKAEIWGLGEKLILVKYTLI